MKKLLLTICSIISLNAFSSVSSVEVAINALRCSAIFYSQTAIPEKADLFGQYGQIYQQIYAHNYEDLTGENLTYGDLSRARGQELLRIASELTEESDGDFVLAKEFRHCAYWLQDIALYLNEIETDFPEIHTAESALEEKQIFLSIPIKSSTTEFNDDLHLYDDTLWEGFVLWVEMGSPLSFGDQLNQFIELKND
jgi:hypothetical protein